ncbi:FadR/GntR family transcriptional regulator [Streptomyces sp. H51]|uniref:FadR/GntR family transcriptional regulator n=1 Tax=Streptomyces sp. H51 TaxID=3111770 RepID=UPI002D786C4F|nr:FCD domain-containing protein [Streptomyces sp. H51]
MSALAALLGSSTGVGRAQEVVQRITEAIYLGLLSDGEKLPVEVQLAAQFNVAPMTVREALSELREQGLVETKRGRSGGSFVRHPKAPPVEPQRQRLAAMTISGLRDIVDEHLAVAGRSAQLAAERASAVNVRRLFGLTEQLRTADNLGDRIRADCRFHIELAVAAQSPRLTRLEANLQAEVSGLLWLPIGPEIDLDAVVEEHHAIATAVVSENGDEARRLTEEHVAGNLRRLTALHLLQIEEGAQL